MSIYNSYRTSAYKKSAPENKELSSIINNIKSGLYTENIKQIQNETSSEKQTKLKKSLPLFKSCLDGDNQPNGLVHFDIDVKDNPSIDFSKLKQDVLKIPELAYCFFSPRGGLKLAVKTDFKSIDAYDRLRFKTAYSITKAHIQSNIELIAFDDSLASISQDCFVSHDPDAYINIDAPLLKLNDDCVHVVEDYSRLGTGNSIPESFIQKLLSWIPSDVDYDERLLINYEVLHELGEFGINLLMAQWGAKNHSKLKSQLKNCTFGNIGTLIKIARKYGYKFKHGVKDSDYKFSDLLTIDQADTKLKDAIHNFFDNGVSTFLNASAGFGKTTDTLDILRLLPQSKQVLVLVQTHEFAEELIEKYTDIKKNSFGTNEVTFENLLNPNKKISGIIHIKGRSHFTNEQDYINQFNSIANIRVLTHEELMNEQANYWYGSSNGDYSAPRKGNRKPDYIIVDENCWKRIPVSSNLNTDYSSIRKIISNVVDDGLTLKQAVNNNIDDVNADYQKIKAVKSPSLHDIHTEMKTDNRRNVVDTLIQNRKDKWKDYYHLQNNELLILKALKMGDLNQLRVIEQLKELHLFKMNEVHSRFKDVPILYLDATANQTVIKTLLPDVEYVDLKVKQSDDVQVYMAEDFPCSKKWLSKQDNLDQLVEMLKKKVAENSNIGFITYLNIEGIEGKFDKWLSAETGIELYEHFGNLRGSDRFENVDELYIIGRQHLKPYEFNNLACAVFDDKDISDDQEWLDCPVRMKDGTTKSIKNKKYIDNRLELVKQHFSDSETLQAIGRIRAIHGNAKKKVYLLSKESLGADVEIVGFISKKNMFNFTKFDGAISKLKTIGYCRAMPKYLHKLGLSEAEAKKVNRDVLHDELINAGIEVADVKFKDKNRIPREWEFYVSDVGQLKAHLDDMGATVI